MASVAEAFVTLRPDTQKFGGELKSKLGGLAGVAGKAALGIGAAIAGTAAAGLKAFSGLQAGMNEVFTLLPGISEDAMSEMTGQVKDFSKEFGVLPDEVVPALYQSLSAGVPRDNVFEFLETAQMAAMGGVTELETAVDGISSVVNSYGEDVIDATKASDLMFTAVRLGKTDFEQLSQSLFNVLPTASSLGVKFEDVTAAMAEMTAQGVPTSVATTQMRQLLIELSKEGGKAAETFQEMSGKTFKEFIAEGGNTADALDLMRQAAEENGMSLSDMFGSVEAGAAALQLAGEDTESYRGALDEMAGAAGATEAAHEQMDQGLSRSWERIKTNVMVALTDIGERLAPTFQVFADWVVDNMPAITEFVVGAFETIAHWAGVLGEAFSRHAETVKKWWENEVKPRIREFREAIDENWPKIRRAFSALGETVTHIAEIFGKQASNMTDDAESEGGSITDAVNSIATTFEALAVTVETVTGAIAATWDWLGPVLTGDFSSITSAAMKMGSDIGQSVRGWVDDVVAWMRELPGRIRMAVGNLQTLLREAGRQLLSGLIDGITSKVSDAVRAVKDAVGSVVGGAKRALGIRSPSKVFEGIGENVTEGLLQGLVRDSGRVSRAMLGMIDTPKVPTFKAPSVSGGGGGLRAGDRLRLVVDGREFSAYVDERADGRVDRRDGDMLVGLRKGPR